MAKEPTATAFTKKQASWANFVLEKIQKKIDDREEDLRERGWSADDMSDDPTLIDLYDDEFFYIRYAKEMADQNEYFKEKYYGAE